MVFPSTFYYIMYDFNIDQSLKNTRYTIETGKHVYFTDRIFSLYQSPNDISSGYLLCYLPAYSASLAPSVGTIYWFGNRSLPLGLLSMFSR